MAPRLEDAIKLLPAAKVEEVAQFAERLAASQRKPPALEQFLKISWVGAAKSLAADYPSGVEIAHAAHHLRSQSF